MENIVKMRLNELQKDISITGHKYSPHIIIMNQELFQSLSDQERVVCRCLSGCRYLIRENQPVHRSAYYRYGGGAAHNNIRPANIDVSAELDHELVAG
jgi:hypothetical protein